MFNSEIQPVQPKSCAGVFCTQFIHLTETGCCDQKNLNSKVKKKKKKKKKTFNQSHLLEKLKSSPAHSTSKPVKICKTIEDSTSHITVTKNKYKKCT